MEIWRLKVAAQEEDEPAATTEDDIVSQLSIGFEEVIKEGSGTEVKRNKLV